MDSFLKNLRVQVQCSLCNEMMIEPKLLQCFHTFCKPCIKRHAQLDEQVNIFKCPQCTSETLLEELDDVEDLQISPIHSKILQVLSFVENQKVCSVSATHSEAVWKCLVCDSSLCDDCLVSHSVFTKDHKVVSLCNLKKEDIEVMLKRESPCKIHANHEVELYCQTCDELMCLFCLRDHHHSTDSHKMTSLQEIINAEKDSLSKNLKEIEKLSSNEEKKKQHEKIAFKIKRDGEKAKEQVKKLTKKLVKALVDNEQQLLNEIQNSITKADRNLRIIRHTPAAQEYIKYFMQNGTASEMIDIRDAKCSKTFTFSPFLLTHNGMEFNVNEQLCRQVNTGLGMVRTLEKADPKKSSFKIESDVEAMKKAKLAVVLKTSKGEMCDALLNDVGIQITPEDDVKVGEKQVVTDGKLEVTFTPYVPGQLTAKVQVHGNPVSNSPLVMDVKPQHMEEITAHSKLKNALNAGSNYYTGIAVNSTSNKIAVADCYSHCIKVFNMEGDLQLKYGNKGSGQEQLKHPHGLAFLNETDLVIADNINHRICIVNTSTGELLRTFGHQGNGNGQFSHPWGVHVDGEANIFVCDSTNRRVQVLTKDGDYQYQFNVPNGKPFCTVAHNGLFYISDYGNSVVHVIEIKGNLSPYIVKTIDGKDYTDGQLQHPRGLAIDNDNNLLVCDTGTKSVQKFTLDGRYIGKTSKFTQCPQYIAVLNDGQAICTTNQGCIFVFLMPLQ